MPSFYWHNIGSKIGGTAVKQQWWSYLVEKRKISAGFESDPAKGEYTLRKYQVDDVVIAYASGSGAIGYGVIRDPSSYVHLPEGHPESRRDGFHRHRMSIEWQAVISDLSDAIPPAELKDRFGLSHPIQTSVRITDPQKATQLTHYLQTVGHKP